MRDHSNILSAIVMVRVLDVSRMKVDLLMVSRCKTERGHGNLYLNTLRSTVIGLIMLLVFGDKDGY